MIYLKSKIMFLFLVILLLLVVIKQLPTGMKKVTLKESNVEIEIPNFSYVKEECCMYSVTFSSFKSESFLKKKIKEMLSSYEKRVENDKTYYYDSKHNITIEEYGIQKGFFMNQFYFVFSKGKTFQEENKMTLISKYIVNNKTHNIYSNCDRCLKINGTVFSAFNAPVVSYTTIELLLFSLENDSDYIEKISYKDGGSILYKGPDFAMLKCNTVSGNRDIYIGDTTLQYEENYCKR